jgi:hypothetical protein
VCRTVFLETRITIVAPRIIRAHCFDVTVLTKADNTKQEILCLRKNPYNNRQGITK